MLYSADAPEAAGRRSTQYFEIFGNRGIYHEGWVACTRHSIPWLMVEKAPLKDDVWELYHVDEDYLTCPPLSAPPGQIRFAAPRQDTAPRRVEGAVLGGLATRELIAGTLSGSPLNSSSPEVAMVRITALVAAVLVVLGLGLYLGTGRESVTALIPAFAGLALGICAWIGRSEKARRHAMHVAAVLALLGFGGSVGGVFAVLRQLGGEAIDRPQAAWGRTGMAVVCLVYLVFAIRSFVQARRARRGS